MQSVDSTLEIFLASKVLFERRQRRDRDVICKVGFVGPCPVLKLQKPTWTNDSMDEVPNQTGIFFSIWLDEKSMRNNRALYNIHALKLRQLKGHRITSNDFAKSFRQLFDPVKNAWPNASTDYGPQTLMQGWIEITADRFERDLLALMDRFATISLMIDDLLAERVKRFGVRF